MIQKRHRITLSVTATGTKVGYKFIGTIIIKDEKNNEIKFEYISKDCKEKHIDILFSNEKESFHAEGLPLVCFHKLASDQQLIFALAMNHIPILIFQVKDSLRLLSKEVTGMMSIVKVSNLLKKSSYFALEEPSYQLIFGSKKNKA